MLKKLDGLKAIGAKGADHGKTLWAIGTDGETWTPNIGLAPRHDDAARAEIRKEIEGQGFEVIEED